MNLEGIIRTVLAGASDVTVNPDYPNLGPSFLNFIAQEVVKKMNPGIAFGAIVGTGQVMSIGSATSSLPRMTTAVRDGLADEEASPLIFNITTDQFEYWTGAAWALAVGYATTNESFEFEPEFVLIFNRTDNTFFLSGRGEADGAAWRFADTVANARITAGGITFGTGQFFIGVEATINTAADDLYYFAVGL